MNKERLTSYERKLLNGPHYYRRGLPVRIYWTMPLWGIISYHKVLNTSQVCRKFNECPKKSCNDFIGWKGESRLETCKRNRCTLHYFDILKALGILEKIGLIKSTKMRFWDEGRRRKTDLFRFWYVDDKDFREIILRQTLDYYL